MGLHQEQEMNCTKCGTGIVENQYVKCLEDFYHISCFVCYHCNSLFGGFVYRSTNNRLMCEECYLHRLPRCTKCNEKLLTGKCIQSTNGTLFHLDCLCCDTCHQTIANGHDAYFSMSDDKFACPNHQPIYNPTQCTSCNQNIEPDSSGEIQWVSSSIGHFHRSCFTCDQCKRETPEATEWYLFESLGEKLCPKCLTSKATLLDMKQPRRCSLRLKSIENINQSPKIVSNQRRWRI